VGTRGRVGLGDVGEEPRVRRDGRALGDLREEPQEPGMARVSRVAVAPHGW